MGNKAVYNLPNQPCGTVKVTFHNTKVGSIHPRFIRKKTLGRHGYQIDEERGLLIKAK